MLSDYSTLSNAYGSCYSLSENYIEEDFRDAFGGYSSLGVRTTGGDFSGLRSFSAPAPFPRPPPPGPHPRPSPPGPHPRPSPLGLRPYHHIPTFPDWYGPFYRNYYYPYFYNRYTTNRFTFFDSLNDIKNKYPTLPSESDKNIIKDFIINLPTIVPCDLPCRDYVKFFIETYLKNNDLEKIVSNKYELVKFIDELKIDINNRYGYQIRSFENTIGI
uniref:ERV/ALR sulfhydryl oxidase domain-containing protein n=1 Tax=viral metagenome TaxID=1070528 RepID=A0A6C0DZR9_9ZZZZ